MLPYSLLAFCLTAITARAQLSSESSSATSESSSSTSSNSSTGSTQPSGEFSYTQSLSIITTSIPESFTGTQYTYASYEGQSTVNTGNATISTGVQNSTATSSSANAQITRTSTSESVTALVGSARTSNGTVSATSSSTGPVNTRACNGAVEFCNRSYGNITMVCAHNSAFVVPNNAASNQQLSIEDQLNDGIRMLQGETQWVNETVYNCHTSCDLLNAGTWQSELETVVSWLRRNPYEVLTMLIVNSDVTAVENYVPAIKNSGIEQYLYIPPVTPMHRDQWPTLGELILSGKRMIMFMDYNANVKSVPYILDEFSHMTETVFSPQQDDFKNCSTARPPNVNQTYARTSLMNLVNQNLNIAVDLGALLGSSSTDAILIPNTAAINTTNGMFNTTGQLGLRATECVEEWDRAPNWLLVDYYNYGDSSPGSVFEVAARMNGVTYNRKCCGVASAGSSLRASYVVLPVALLMAVGILG